MRLSLSRSTNGLESLIKAIFLFVNFVLATTLIPASALADAEPTKDVVVGAPKDATASVPIVSWNNPQSQPKVAVLCIHGLGLHKGTYEAFAKRLSADGVVLYAIDIRGFGQWQANGQSTIDFPKSLEDVKATLIKIHHDYPDLPVVILGESMGGAIALHAAALYPDLIAGLISSVPAGDRFGQTEEELKVGFHALTSGFHSDMNVGRGVVRQATQKEDLRKVWENDPLGRMNLSPNELMEFQSFMNANFACAAQIKQMPVLFIAGMNDKLVRPAASWKLYDNLPTPLKELVYSKSAEHLIFEEGQFTADDISFVETWLSNSILKSPNALGKANESIKIADVDENAPRKDVETSVAYWIELLRDGKMYRSNNKSVFRSGDSIRFHMQPAADGYAYILMKQSSTGKQAVLFPEARTGLVNSVSAGKDYALPTKTWLKFDDHPGVEKVTLLFSRTAMDMSKISGATLTSAYVSPDRSGSKDLVPTRMQLSWDDPEPVIIPTSFSPRTTIAGKSEDVNSDNQSSLVRVSQPGITEPLAVDIALSHM